MALLRLRAHGVLKSSTITWGLNASIVSGRSITRELSIVQILTPTNKIYEKG